MYGALHPGIGFERYRTGSDQVYDLVCAVDAVDFADEWMHGQHNQQEKNFRRRNAWPRPENGAMKSMIS